LDIPEDSTMGKVSPVESQQIPGSGCTRDRDMTTIVWIAHIDRFTTGVVGRREHGFEIPAHQLNVAVYIVSDAFEDG
jgi:hypothetical protein